MVPVHERKKMRWSDKKGFWWTFALDEACGIAFSIVYIPEGRDLQISFLLGFVHIGAGYTF